MKNEKDAMSELFGSFEGQWDTMEPGFGHADRFLDKLSRKKTKSRDWLPLSIAATVLIIVGFFTFFNNNPEMAGFEYASKQTRETDSVFTAMIRIELEKVKEKNSPENERIVRDALVQMEAMDADYEKIKEELLTKGETKQIIHAMIRNLQTRISFLENVLLQIENNENFKNKNNENTI